MGEVLEQPGILASLRSLSAQDPSHPKIPVNPRSQSAQDPSQHWIPSCLFGIWLMLLYLTHVKFASTKFFKHILHTHLDFSYSYLVNWHFSSLLYYLLYFHLAISFNFIIIYVVTSDKKKPDHRITLLCTEMVRFFSYQKLDTYKESPDSTVFMPPGNRTIAKTVLIGD